MTNATNADLRRWQRQSYADLGELLDLQDRRDLPVIDWTITPFSLASRCLQTDDGERREVFGAWVAALGLAVREYRSSGVTHLRGTGKYEDRIVVGVVADISEDEDETNE